MPRQMRAIGAAAGDQFGVAIEQQRRAIVLNDRRQRLDTGDHGALIGLRFQPQQHRRDIGLPASSAGRLAKSADGSSTTGVAR